MHTAVNIISLVAGLALIITLVVACWKNRGSADAASVRASMPWYTASVAAATVALVAQVFDLDWWSLINVVTFASTAISRHMARRRLGYAEEGERWAAEQAARANDLPWMDVRS